MSYRLLKSDETIQTIELLTQRISERFPSSGLAKVSLELLDVSKESKEKTEWIKKPDNRIRFSVGAVIGLSILILMYSISLIDMEISHYDLGSWFQVTESIVNDLIFIGIAIFFLVTLESRVKRHRALSALHELRSIAHVIDMHQLTKDPSKLVKGASDTGSSPKRGMSIFELIRYLDYCSELLSLTGKVSALYAQNFDDSVILAAVNEVESLTTGLSRKIWQKIMILHKLNAEQ